MAEKQVLSPVSFRMPMAEKRAFERAAAAEGRSVSGQVLFLLRQWMRDREKAGEK